ncbi:MAG: nucleotidyltransferase domain-containing protein [Bacilli bacterium]
MNDFENLVNEFSKNEEVQAITLGGSRAKSDSDTLSDYDIYIYLNKNFDISKRNNILKKYCKYFEIDNNYWETEDDCILNSGEPVDIIYRDLKVIDSKIEMVVNKGIVGEGYSTTFLDNFINSKILYSKDGKIEETRSKYKAKYPQMLKYNIIKKNMNLLTGFLPSYDKQIKKAIERDDYVNIINRVDKFLESYFDIIFAYNEVLNPGEKRLIQYATKNCMFLPKDFEKNLNVLFKNLSKKENIGSIIDLIVKNIKDLIKY